MIVMLFLRVIRKRVRIRIRVKVRVRVREGYQNGNITLVK
jgi:hypothetical protein